MARKPKIISAFNLKGGVGKTTFITNLAVYLSAKKFKVCLLDLDSSNNVQKSFNVQAKINLHDYFKSNKKVGFEELIHVYNDDLTLICADEALFLVNQQYQSDKSAIQAKITTLITWLKTKYDYILIDHQPSFSFLGNAFLKLSDYLFLINELDLYSLSGLVEILKYLKLKQFKAIQKVFCVTNKHIKNSVNQNLVLKEFEAYILNLKNPKIQLLPQTIRRSIQLANAILNNYKPLLATKIHCTVKQDYLNLLEAIKI